MVDTDIYFYFFRFYFYLLRAAILFFNSIFHFFFLLISYIYIEYTVKIYNTSYSNYFKITIFNFKNLTSHNFF